VSFIATEREMPARSRFVLTIPTSMEFSERGLLSARVDQAVGDAAFAPACG